MAKAQRYYRRALTVTENPAPYVNMGRMAYDTGDKAEAERLYRRALTLDPNCSVGLNNLGVVLIESGRTQEAADTYIRSIKVRPTPEAYSNLADIYCGEELYSEALDLTTAALKLAPSHPQALTNSAMVLWAQNEYDLAVQALRLAIKNGAHPKAHVNLGILLLMTGQYAEGWKEYAWRFSANNVPMRGPSWMPIWKGRGNVLGSLYVWGEQGLGDEILYASNMTYAASKAEYVVWECDPRLAVLLQRGAPKNIRVVPRKDAPPLEPDMMLQIPAGCLAQMNAPSGVPYMKANLERTRCYRLAMPTDKLIIGIAWHSANAKYGHKKSLTIADFAAFIENEANHCVSLQYGDHDHGPLNVVPGLDLTNDIDGVAALIKACDLVVTVSNTVAHLAGALGVPCLVLVSDAGGKLWYWGTGDRTPWYDSVRIERFARHPIQDVLP